MRGLEESTEALLHSGTIARRKVIGFWTGFSDFALRDNVLDVAVGLM
jgi:large conductance mechanosensitive channel